MTREAEAKVHQAIAEKTPDWSWGIDYLRRGREYGDMVNLSVSFDLPLFTSSRQDPKIAAERARLAQIEAQRQATCLPQPSDNRLQKKTRKCSIGMTLWSPSKSSISRASRHSWIWN